VVEFAGLGAVEADDVGEEFELGVGEVAVGAVELAEDVASVDEEDVVGAGGVGDAFLAVYGDFGGGIFLMGFDESGGLDEHAAGAAGGVEDAAVVGLEDFDDEADDGGGRVEFAAFLAFAHGEFAEEVFVDEAEGIAALVHGDGGHGFEEGGERAAFEDVVGFGEDVGEVGVFFFDGAHGVIDGLADLGAFGEAEEMGEAGVVGQEDDTGGVEVGGADFASGAGLGFQVFGDGGEADIGVAEEDEAEDGGRVFGGFEGGTGPELVGGVPEGFLKGGVGVVGGGGFGPVHEWVGG
jgi:hypothetical protein